MRSCPLKLLIHNSFFVFEEQLLHWHHIFRFVCIVLLIELFFKLFEKLRLQLSRHLSSLQCWHLSILCNTRNTFSKWILDLSFHLMLNLINNKFINIITSKNHKIIEKVTTIDLCLINSINCINNESFISQIKSSSITTNDRSKDTNHISNKDNRTKCTNYDCNLLCEELTYFGTIPDKYKPYNNTNDFQWIVNELVEFSIVKNVEVVVVYWFVKHRHYSYA